MSFRRPAIAALLFLLAVRLAAMALIPLNETTEARYGEIARKMLETGNWVTLLHDYAIPFLAKPPLSTWLSAASMGILGVNELAVRLPALLLSISVLWLTGFAAARRHRAAAETAVLALAGSLGFFLAAGTVMTDPALLFCTTLVMIAFWQAVQGDKSPWRYVFFVACGLGLLAKGPVALVLPGLPIFAWVAIKNQWRALWRGLPWISGSLLTLAIALPWYALAEMRTPGFLEYFIIGENFSRFLDPHWKGDQYGFAHAYPHGMIWLFALGGLLPWSGPAVVWAARRWRQLLSWAQEADGWVLYLLLWALATPVFFTFAANIIWPYSLTMMPAFALLFAEGWARSGRAPAGALAGVAALAGVVGALAAAAFVACPQKVANAQKDVVAAWQAERPDPASRLLFWGNRMEFSAAFYSAGRARSTGEAGEARALLNNKTRDYIVVNDTKLDSLPPDVRRQFTEIGRYANKRGTRILLREAPR